MKNYIQIVTGAANFFLSLAITDNQHGETVEHRTRPHWLRPLLYTWQTLIGSPT
jgi:hypothetical protein